MEKNVLTYDSPPHHSWNYRLWRGEPEVSAADMGGQPQMSMLYQDSQSSPGTTINPQASHTRMVGV